VRNPSGRDDIDMELFFLVFFVLLAVFSALGWTADSRDGADWTPTAAGRRQPRRL
jgi:hypothetical protein